jgi:peptidoglycan-associated lipoprotein
MNHTTAILSVLFALGCGSTPPTEATQTTVRPPATAETRPAPIAEAEREPGPPECQLGAVFYEFDSSDLDASSRQTLNDNVRCMQVKNVSALNVVGMADPRGTEEYNLALGDRRARSAVQYLRSLGVEDGNINMTSVGEEYASGTDESSWARDRRSDITTQ